MTSKLRISSYIEESISSFEKEMTIKYGIPKRYSVKKYAGSGGVSERLISRSLLVFQDNGNGIRLIIAQAKPGISKKDLGIIATKVFMSMRQRVPGSSVRIYDSKGDKYEEN
jgi:hypothetical protein